MAKMAKMVKMNRNQFEKLIKNGAKIHLKIRKVPKMAKMNRNPFEKLIKN